MKTNKISSKFNNDLLWNIGAFGVSAVIGILLNVIIISYYDSAALGVFNLIYAVYIMLSQLAVSGVHLAVHKYVPQFSADNNSINSIVSSSIILALCTSVLVISIAYIFNEVPGNLTNSSGVVLGFKYVIWGLLFFSINKVLLSFLNGIRQMRAFAIFQLMRFVGMLFFLLVFIYIDLESYKLALILPLTELALFVAVLIYSQKFFSFKLSSSFTYWFRKNFSFGNKALIGNFLFDINTKVDIFMLGIFLTDSLVGIYSIAATIAEGFIHLPTLMRNNINPILTKAHTSKGYETLNKVILKSKKSFFKITALLGLVAIAGFPLFLLVFGITENFYLIWAIFATLALGIILSGGYLPFQMVFNQLGLPLLQTKFIFFVFMVNVILNAVFIPLTGVIGAAIGTSGALVIQIFILKRLSKKATNSQLII